jgi:hypothetical protein
MPVVVRTGLAAGVVVSDWARAGAASSAIAAVRVMNFNIDILL